MTWTWEITGLGTPEQTLVVYNDSGKQVASKIQESWTWKGDYPEFVYNTVVKNDIQAALMEDIANVDEVSQ